MKWTKLKQKIENMVADSLQGRVEFRCTRYRKSHDREGKGWITVDKKEIYDMCSMKWMIESNTLTRNIQEANHCLDFRNPSQQNGYYDAIKDAHEIMKKKSMYSLWEYHEKLFNYLSLSIDNALQSEDVLTRAIAMIDSRFGKRRLAKYEMKENEHPLVKYMFNLRCEAEKMENNYSENNFKNESKIKVLLPLLWLRYSSGRTPWNFLYLPIVGCNKLEQ